MSSICPSVTPMTQSSKSFYITWRVVDLIGGVCIQERLRELGLIILEKSLKRPYYGNKYYIVIYKYYTVTKYLYCSA